MFEAGRRVRCVVAQWFEGASPSRDSPTLGAVYTVIDATTTVHFSLGPIDVIELAEKPPRDGARLLYAAAGFRPLEDAEFERLREACLPPPLKARELAALLT